MPFEFIDRLVMVMSVAERCCGVCWPSPASVHGRFTAVKSTNPGTSISLTSLGTTSKPADKGSAMGPEMGPATRPRHAY